MWPRPAIFALLFTATLVRAEWPFPSPDGSAWQYVLTREPDGDRTTLSRQIFAFGNPRGAPSLRLEEAIDGAPQLTQFLRSDHDAVLATSERSADGKTTVFDPPATILPARLERGASWNFRGNIAGVEVALPLRIAGEEEIEVPAGKFHAWHIHGEQAGTIATSVDEWFVRGVGSVKERVTQRAATGQLLARHTLELTVLPVSTSAVNAGPGSDFFEASVSTSTAGAPMDTISADALQIVARWRARHAGGEAKVRAVWIAEDTGALASPDYKIDEATAIATPPESVGAFTLSRPPDGWAAGKYRVEFYLRNSLAATVRITIVPRAAAVEDASHF